MPATKDQAIVLRRLDYSETSQVLVFLTRQHGQQRLIAKGIKRGSKKEFATGIDLLERGQLVFVSKTRAESTLGTLTEWRQTDAHLGLREDLQRWHVSQYAAETSAAMVEVGDPHPDLFDALAELLSSLCAGSDPLSKLVGYQCVALTSAGLWPDLTRCVMCDLPAPAGRSAYYSAHQGGLVCSSCVEPLPEKRKVSAATLTALREGTWSADSARGGFGFLDYTISHVIGRKPALSKFILS